MQSAHQLSDSQKCAVIGTCVLQNSLHHAARNMITAVHLVDAPFQLLYPWAFSELWDHEENNTSRPAQWLWEYRIFDHSSMECGGTAKNKHGRISFPYFHAHGSNRDNLNALRVRVRIPGSTCATFVHFPKTFWLIDLSLPLALVQLLTKFYPPAPRGGCQWDFAGAETRRFRTTEGPSEPEGSEPLKVQAATKARPICSRAERPNECSACGAAFI